jgi:hypothetical protein
MKNAPLHMKTLLWEYDIWEIDIDHPIVSERVLNLWDREDIRYMGLERLERNLVEKKVSLDKKSQNFWNIVFSHDKNETPSSLYEQINNPTSRRNFR